MRTEITSLLILATLLSACQLKAPGTTAGKRPVPTAAQPAASTRPAPVPDGTILSGLVQIDAHYVVAAGGGNVVAAGGGNVVAVGGGNVIAPGGGNFRLLAIGPRPVAAAIDVPIGQILPAKGMQIEARSMLTGQPFGAAVVSDDQGGFKVAVPEGTKDNVLIVAKVPGATDARFTLSLVASATDSQAQVVDEDTAVVSQYLRQSLVGRLAAVLNPDNLATPGASQIDQLLDEQKVPEFLRGSASKLLTDMQKKAIETGVAKKPEADRRLYAQRITEVLLAKADLKSIMTDGENPEPAFAALVDVMRQERTAAEAKMKAEPAYFTKPGTRYTGQRHVQFEIKRPADLGQFIVNEYMSQVGMEAFEKLADLHQEIGVADGQDLRAKSAAVSVVKGLVLVLMTNTEANKAALAVFDQPL